MQLDNLSFVKQSLRKARKSYIFIQISPVCKLHSGSELCTLSRPLTPSGHKGVEEIPAPGWCTAPPGPKGEYFPTYETKSLIVIYPDSVASLHF